MTDDTLLADIRALTPDERAEIQKLVQALKRSRVSPLAFVEEMMHFEGDADAGEDGLYTHRMEVTHALKNRIGMLHGGITATFIDTAMGAAVFQLTGDANGAVTLDLSVNFIAPAWDGWLTAKTEIVQKGGRIIVMLTRVYNEDDNVIATATGTYYQLRKNQ